MMMETVTNAESRETDTPEVSATNQSEVASLIRGVKARIDKHKGAVERPARISIIGVKQLPELFQPRGGKGLDERHISELRRGLKIAKELDPVTVFWIGDDPYVIDGHHRIAAYLAEEHFGEIPIRTFTGTVEEAVLEAGRANSRVKLAMGPQQRNDYAWRLVQAGSFSKRQIVEAAGVSDRQVGIMRKTKKDLGEEADDSKSWWDAQSRAKGITRELLTDDEQEQRMEDLANSYADKMAKAFTTKLANNPDVAARTLAIYFGRNLGEVWGKLKEHLSEDNDPDGYYDPHADF